MQRVDRVDESKGLFGVGSKYHCYYETGEVTFTITDWNHPIHFVSDEIAFGIPIQFTIRIQLVEGGAQIQIMYDEPQQGNKEALKPLFREAAQEALHRLAAIVEAI